MHADFFADHPNFMYSFNFHKDIFASPNTLLSIATSDKALQSYEQGCDLLLIEVSLIMCKDKQWASFLSLFALSSITNRRLICFHPNFVLLN